MNLVVFDDPLTWEASLARALGEHLSRRLDALSESHEFIEDSISTLLTEEKDSILGKTLSWLAAHDIAAYHGTRLELSELEAIREKGLMPLVAKDRVIRLERSLSKHPNWLSAAPRLMEEVERGGLGHTIGNRAGQAHLTLSRSGLARGFSHYLTYGSEFDQRIAHRLLGQEGVELLAHDGSAYILEFAVPGPIAIAAAHRYFSPEEMIARDETPNVAREFLGVLSYRVSNRSFDPTQLRVDCGLVFSAPVPADWLRSVTGWPW